MVLLTLSKMTIPDVTKTEKWPYTCVSSGRCLEHSMRSTLWAGGDVWEIYLNVFHYLSATLSKAGCLL